MQHEFYRLGPPGSNPSAPLSGTWVLNGSRCDVTQIQPGVYYLAALASAQQGVGNASGLLRQIGQQADALGVVVTLVCTPDLVPFYRGLDYTHVGQEGNTVMLARTPHQGRAGGPGFMHADSGCPVCFPQSQHAFAAVPAEPLHNPELGGRHWFHGTNFEPEDDHQQQRAEDFGHHSPDPGGYLEHPEGREYDEERDSHWNTGLGVHFTGLPHVAESFANGKGGAWGTTPSRNSRVAHAHLHMANPKHYADETEMAKHAISIAHEHGHRYFGSDEEDGRKKFESGEPVHDHEQWDEHSDYLERAQQNLSPHGRAAVMDIDKHGVQPHHGLHEMDSYLAQHPHREQVLWNYQEHLREKGHDGITYGNEYEGPKGHRCAIVTDPSQIHVRKWDWLHPDHPNHKSNNTHDWAGTGQNAISDYVHPDGRPKTAAYSDFLKPEHREHQDTRPGFNPGDDLSGMGYGHGVGWVHIDHLKPYREYDRAGTHPGSEESGESTSYTRSVVDSIHHELASGRGFTDPLMLKYHHETHQASLGEGNHRLDAAIKAGMTHVPVRVVRAYKGEAESGEMKPAQFPKQTPKGYEDHLGNYRQPEMQHPAEVFPPEAMHKSAHVLTDWQPKERLFSPTKKTLDPRLFSDKKMLPQVRSVLMQKMDRFMSEHGGPQWTSWARMYLAGSEASLWWGNNDFDILVGVNYDAFRKATGSTLADEEITDAFNRAFRVDWNNEQWHPPFRPDEEWHLTGYVNPDSYDIRKIKPYAAYEVVSDTWFVEPIDEPTGHTFDESQWYYMEGFAERIRAAMELREPSRSNALNRIWTFLHKDRSRAFGPNGTGAFDRGNATEKYLDQAGLWDVLVQSRFGKQANVSTTDDPAGKDARFDGVSLKQDDDGYYVTTHRARSKSYPTPEAIPQSKVDFIESTGSVGTYSYRHVVGNWKYGDHTWGDEVPHQTDGDVQRNSKLSSGGAHFEHQYVRSGVPVAKLRYEMKPDHDDGHPGVLHVEALAVHPSHRGGGLAHALMDQMQQHAEATGMTIDHGDRTSKGRRWWASYSNGPTHKPHLHEPDTDTGKDGEPSDWADRVADQFGESQFDQHEWEKGKTAAVSWGDDQGWDHYYANESNRPSGWLRHLLDGTFSQAFTAHGFDHDEPREHVMERHRLISPPSLQSQAAIHDFELPRTKDSYYLSPEEKEKQVAEYHQKHQEWHSNVSRALGMDPEKTDQFEVKRAWDHHIRHAIGVGDLTIGQAELKGYRGDGNEHGRATGDWAPSTGSEEPRFGGYKPLPATMHHVTTDSESVLSSGGLKTRREQGSVSGKGLGGGSDHHISVTSDESMAHDIYHSLHEYHAYLNGHISHDDLLTKHIGNADPEKLHHSLKNVMGEEQHRQFMQGMTSSSKGANFEERSKPENQSPDFGTLAEAQAKHGADWTIKPHHVEHGIQGSDGQLRYPSHSFERPVTSDEKIEQRSSFYKNYSWLRGSHGGHRDPLFMSNDPVGFAKSDPSKFSILHLHPATPKAQGYPLSRDGAHHADADSGEWRVPTGDALKIHSESAPIPRWEHEQAAHDEAHYRHTAANVYGMGARGPDYDNLHFQDDGAMIAAVHPQHGNVGTLEYEHHSEGTREHPFEHIRVHELETTPGHYRRGVANSLMHELESSNPGVPIDHGMRTSEGNEWAAKRYGFDPDGADHLGEGMFHAGWTKDGQHFEPHMHAHARVHHPEQGPDGEPADGIMRLHEIDHGPEVPHGLRELGVDPEKAVFKKTSVPVASLHPTHLNDIEDDEDYYRTENLVSSGGNHPPIVMAKGHLLDGYARVNAAHTRGERHIEAHVLHEGDGIVRHHASDVHQSRPVRPLDGEGSVGWRASSVYAQAEGEVRQGGRTAGSSGGLAAPSRPDLAEPRRTPSVSCSEVYSDRAPGLQVVRPSHLGASVGAQPQPREDALQERSRVHAEELRGGVEWASGSALLGLHEAGQRQPQVEARVHRPVEGPNGEASDGVMIALVPPKRVINNLPLPEDGEHPSNVHITLVYMGKIKDFTKAQVEYLPEVIEAWAETQRPLKATVQGVGTFANPGSHVLWAAADIPGGNHMWVSLADTLRGHGYKFAENHGWTPHLTMSYEKHHVRFLPKVERMEFQVREVWCCIGGRWESFRLTGK